MTAPRDSVHRKTRPTLVLGTAVVALGFVAAGFLLLTKPASTSQDGSGSAPAAAVAEPAAPADSAAAPHAPKTDAAAPAGAATVTPEARPLGAARLDAETRRALLAALAQALAAPAVPAAEGSHPDPGPGSLDKAYIKESIDEIKPLLRECFELARHERPDTAGTVKVRFTIIGDPELGGLVEESEILEGTAAADPVLSECVRETMYALRFEAPKGGGRVTVTYPFVFLQAGSGK